MPERFAQDLPDVHIDFGAFADAIWHSFEDHIGEVGQAIWTPFTEWLTNGIHQSADAVWADSTVAMSELLFQLPKALTYAFPGYLAVATNPVPVALGGATLAIVLLGIRTIFGAFIGRDHVLTHISGRLLPAVACAAAFEFIAGWTVDHINQIAASVPAAAVGGLMRFPGAPANPFLLPVYLLLWVLLIFYGVKLLVRVAYGLFRFLVTLVFGPVAIVLWAIPQTEWITSFWLREFVGWGTTPILVAVCLSMAVPLAMGSAGFLAAALFGVAGLKAASDLVGLFAMSKGGGGGGMGVTPFALARLAAGAVSGGAGAAASIPANRVTTLADTYGYD